MDNHLSSLIRKQQKLDQQISRIEGNEELIESLTTLNMKLKTRIQDLHRNLGAPSRRSV